MKHEKLKMSASVFFTLLVLATYCAWDYLKEEKQLIAQIDAKLYSAAASVAFVLEDDFHDRVYDEKSISK